MWKLFRQKPKRVYLDWAAATPLTEAVVRAMAPYVVTHFANPSAVHQEGQVAHDAVTTARTEIARTLQLRPDAVVFAGSGTEANQLAIIGTVMAAYESGMQFTDMSILTTELEHPSVHGVLATLASWGVRIIYLPVDEAGKITVSAVAERLEAGTVLCTTAYVNSEIGVIQPINKLAKAVRQRADQLGVKVRIHIDAAQAPLWLPCGLDRLQVDMATFDAGKCCGPKGVGFLAGRCVHELRPLFSGGGQESGLRPGTENVPGIVGAATAFQWAQAEHEARAQRVAKVRDGFLQLLSKRLPEVVINGPQGDDRVANNVNVSLPGFDTEYAVVTLDHGGVAASSKSACSGAGGGESRAVRAISGDAARAAATLRFTLGPDTTLSECERAVSLLETYRDRMRQLTQT